MPSANTVAQKPAGNFNPLSSLGHALLVVAASALTWLCANTNGHPTQKKVPPTTVVRTALNKLDNRIKRSPQISTARSEDIMIEKSNIAIEKVHAPGRHKFPTPSPSSEEGAAGPHANAKKTGLSRGCRDRPARLYGKTAK